MVGGVRCREHVASTRDGETVCVCEESSTGLLGRQTWMEDLAGLWMAWSRGPGSPGTALDPTPPWFLRHCRRLPAAVAHDEFCRKQDVEKLFRGGFPPFFPPPRPGLGSSPWSRGCVFHVCTSPHATVLPPRPSLWTTVLSRAVASWLLGPDSSSQARFHCCLSSATGKCPLWVQLNSRVPLTKR